MQIPKEHSTETSFLQSINAFLGKVETGALCLIVAMMLGLAVLKIVMRYIFSASLLWSDIMLQHLTLWLCFFGAALATCERRHISIDVLSRILPGKVTRWTNLAIDCIAVVVVGILAYYGFLFLGDEQSSEAVLIGSVPLWWAKTIIPYGFVLIGIHVVLQIGMHLTDSADTRDAVEGESESWD
ncbi:TRAP transporter small permease [Candidatus Poribacteria bacterium]|nr:TRAP transporter small permease [Candidatus Poribacteria bacterium]MYH81988.1 TRAP transporter small permease [Candidatus Poribacteria bacterium]MYK97006.1 TRAP transporter small permease [Candidatus Poribacteria bacterium]